MLVNVYVHPWYPSNVMVDVPPSSKPGALARSAWNTQGRMFQECLTPKIAPCYQKDWTLYLGNRSPNHKNSVAIMQEMGDTTGIDASALVAFHPGTHRRRQDTRNIAVMHTPIIELSAISFSTATCIHTCTPGCCSALMYGALGPRRTERVLMLLLW
jgi:hypothetical protein